MHKISFLATILLLASTGPVGALTLELSPPSPFSVSGGDTVTVSAVVEDLGNEVVTSYDITVDFDAAIFQWDDYAFVDNPLGDADQFESNYAITIDPSGSVNVAAWSHLSNSALFALQAGGPITLFSLDFYAGTSGTAVFALSATSAPTLSTAPVPEPGTMLLLGTGLVGLAGYGRKRRAA